MKKIDVRIPSTGGTLADAEVLSRREIHQQCIRAKEMLEKQQERESLEVRELAGAAALSFPVTARYFCLFSDSQRSLGCGQPRRHLRRKLPNQLYSQKIDALAKRCADFIWRNA